MKRCEVGKEKEEKQEEEEELEKIMECKGMRKGSKKRMRLKK